MIQRIPRSQATDSSRRQFLKTSSVAALAGTLSVARSAQAAGSDEIRIALIGCGGRGTGAAAQALKTKAKVKLVALADAFRNRLEHQTTYGARTGWYLSVRHPRCDQGMVDARSMTDSSLHLRLEVPWHRPGGNERSGAAVQRLPAGGERS